MRKLIVIFLALSQWLAIAQQTTNEHIEHCGKLNERYLFNFNSTPANDEFPWIGRVYYEVEGIYIKAVKSYLFDCLAVLISKRHLLIPARCVATTSTKNREPYAVILGADNGCYLLKTCPSPVPNYYEIDSISLHPNLTFDRSQELIVDNDIGIITLKSDVSYNIEVLPICLPSSLESRAHFVGQYLQYAEYPFYRFHPLKAVVYVASLQKCRDMYGSLIIGDSFMCVVQYMHRSIFMPGSPLMGVATKGSPPQPHHFYLIGLTLLRKMANTEGSMITLVSIGPYIEWIRYNIA